MNKHVIAMAIAAAMGSGAAIAGEVQVSAGENVPGFVELDADSNGYVTPAEADAREDLSIKWNDVDADRDGQLSESEFSAFESNAEDRADRMEERADDMEDRADEMEDRVDDKM